MLVRNGSDLVDEQTGFFAALIYFGKFTNACAQRKATARSVAVDLGRAQNDDGGRVTRSIQEIGLNVQSWAAPLARLWFVSLRFKISLPNLATFESLCRLRQARHP